MVGFLLSADVAFAVVVIDEAVGEVIAVVVVVAVELEISVGALSKLVRRQLQVH